ncbi:AAA family ATPase [Plantibacter sp. YIM 135249]|uniref:AAA family ATPase n=1 Tax=Plantibacter sp. YIM 135249 TaxID=3423918 RepID=UPI003D33E03E
MPERNATETSAMVELIRTSQRILVAGSSGSGKSALAAALAAHLDRPYVELDSLFHGAGWIPRKTFVDDVDHFTSRASWITEWQYTDVRELLVDRADLMLSLEFRKPLVMRRLISRTLRRRILHQELWNGNQEPPLHTIFSDRDHIIRWGWRTQAAAPSRVTAAIERAPGLIVARFVHPRQLTAVLETLRTQ